MKKISLLLLVMLMISGCSSSSSNSSLTYMVNTSKNKYGIVDEEGSVLNKGFDKYQAVGDKGYLVTKNDVNSFVDINGKETISAKKYPNLTAKFEMLLSQDEAGNITILSTAGKELYTSSEDMEITVKHNMLPVIHDVKKDKYYVLNEDGSVFMDTKDKVNFTSVLAHKFICINYEKKTVLYFLDEEGEISKESKVDLEGEYYLSSYDSDESEKGIAFLNTEGTAYAFVTAAGKLIYRKPYTYDFTYFANGNLIGVKGDESYLLDIDQGTTDKPVKPGEQGEPILLSSYYSNYKNYTNKTDDLYSHNFVYNGKEKEVDDIQLNPSVIYTGSYPFPVYKREDGFQYYNYDGKQAFKGSYDEVTEYDDNGRAVVCDDDKYWLIDEKGESVSEKYSNLRWAKGTYYAAYENGSKYSIIDVDGNLIIDDVFLGEPELFENDEFMYGIFNKSGTTYVYNLSDDNEVILKRQGTYEYDETQKLIKSEDNKIYYNLDGDLVYKRG